MGLKPTRNGTAGCLTRLFSLAKSDAAFVLANVRAKRHPTTLRAGLAA